MIKKIINNSYTVNYKYLSNGSRTTELIYEINYDSNVIYEYTYDSTGNILKEVVKKLSDNSILNTYTYEYENTN